MCTANLTLAGPECVYRRGYLDHHGHLYHHDLLARRSFLGCAHLLIDPRDDPLVDRLQLACRGW